MKKNLSTNGIYIGVCAAFLVLTVCFHIIVFYHTENPIIRGTAIVFSLLVLLLGIILILLLKGKLVAFSDSLNACIDDIVNGKEDVAFDLESETLTGKFNYKLQRLYEIMQNGKRQVQEEKQSIQEMVSDISHQVKTPITNLKMYNSTLLERHLMPEKAWEFHKLMESQIDKLDFLMQAMVKMSRLETGVITLSVSPAPIYDTIGLALSGIERTAEQKNMEVNVECDSAIIVPHDKKWTAEALFNILDNAVKYTPSVGKISVTVECWEMTTRIDISDTGRGIPEQHYAQIFKRFYREDEVHDISGVGVGLYLCREIISKQGGYIQIKSEIGKGSTFSVFLPNERQL
ncbi:HAMP domain-containing sensor histidine kinase [Proteiniborus sp. MB09-C3]|uniref:sensor histidine kinase n=1 Tax=Proteiniborus sp. MB09-C3 TaxID=3050072 RepID=UPI002554317E|nr:HAMP domain-containing sensor histidine kinase [Proteiniborus sp. MB09-C3]WIV10561.1 HAMP domain-containing sensor histidine kinase [Proteiniborus sp. MB09-C3]